MRSALVLGALFTLVLSPDSPATTAQQARSAAIHWLETHQNLDGSWGSGPTRPLATAEALNALAHAGYQGSPAARRAIAWLRGQELQNLDFEARAIRALAAAGVDVKLAGERLRDLATRGTGWGPTETSQITAYDTALVLRAVHASGATLSGSSAQDRFNEVAGRMTAYPAPAPVLFVYTWSGDRLFYDASDPADHRVTTAEVLRALGPMLDAAGRSNLNLWGYVTGSPTYGGSSYADTPPLELTAQMAALHTSAFRSSASLPALLDDARFPNGIWSEDDPLVNALGLLALVTEGSLPPPAATGNEDGDSVLNQADAFPYDASESIDTDNDGLGDGIDPDRDGDGVCDPGETAPASVCRGSDVRPDDPRETVDSDGDGTPDVADPNDDGDAYLDLEELAYGTDPKRRDTDGDGVDDHLDPCKLVADGTDDDGDGVCTPADACPNDPLDTANTDGTGACDRLDEDDDGDGFLDVEELAWGSDPRLAGSTPPALAETDPTGDFDEDGLFNGLEQPAGLGTSPFLADSDNDGATDLAELGGVVGGSPLDRYASPPPIAAVFSSMSPASEPRATAPGVRMSATGGQATAIGTGRKPGSPSAGDAVLLAGFQAQALHGHDLDLDGLLGITEARRRSSSTSIDSDGDGFVDGPGGVVAVGRLPDGYNLNGDAWIDGEADYPTSPADAADHPGKRGDVAPLGHPDGKVTAADGLLALRLAATPELAEPLGAQAELLCNAAADAVPDGRIGANDALLILREAQTSPR